MDNDEMNMFDLFRSINGYSADEDEGECFDFWNYAMNVLDRIEAHHKLSICVGVSNEGSFLIKVLPIKFDGDPDEDH